MIKDKYKIILIKENHFEMKQYSFSLLKPIYVNEKITLEVYRLRSDKSVIIAKVFKEKNETAFSSEIQLIN